MADLKIADAGIFEQWLEEERVYLEGLHKEPIAEPLEMEYYQKLVNLRASKQVIFCCPFVTVTNVILGRIWRLPVPHGSSQPLKVYQAGRET
jgi:hypothetical protein